MSLNGYEAFGQTFFAGDVAANHDAKYVPLCKLDRKVKVTAVKFSANAAVAANGTNYQQVLLYGGSTFIATIYSSSATVMTAGVWNSYSVPAAKQEIDADTELNLHFSKAASGAAITGLAVQLIGTAY